MLQLLPGEWRPSRRGIGGLQHRQLGASLPTSFQGLGQPAVLSLAAIEGTWAGQDGLLHARKGRSTCALQGFVVLSGTLQVLNYPMVGVQWSAAKLWAVPTVNCSRLLAADGK